MLARGEISARGIVAPEDGICGPLFDTLIDELRKRGVVIRKRLEVIGDAEQEDEAGGDSGPDSSWPMFKPFGTSRGRFRGAEGRSP